MAQFNAFERKLALILSKLPFLKKYIKICYQYIMYCIYKEKNSYYLHPDVKLSEAGDKNGSFGGYYDKSTVKKMAIIYSMYSKEKFLHINVL